MEEYKCPKCHGEVDKWKCAVKDCREEFDHRPDHHEHGGYNRYVVPRCAACKEAGIRCDC